MELGKKLRRALSEATIGRVKKELPSKLQIIGGGVVLAAIAGITGGALVTGENDKKLSDSESIARGLAAGRAACKLTEVKPVVSKHKPALEIGVAVTSLLDPRDVTYKPFEGVFMGVDFRDNPNNYGLSVKNTDHAAEPKRQAFVVDANHAFDNKETVIVTAPITPDRSDYSVSVQVGMTADADGTLAHHKTYDVIAQIPCENTFTYQPGHQPIINQQ